MNNIITYTLGIHSLDNNAQNMVKKEIYWLNTSNESDVKILLDQVVRLNQNLVVNIDERFNNHIGKLDNNVDIRKRNKLFNKVKFNFGLNAKDYVKQIKLNKNTLIILSIPDIDFKNIDNAILYKLLKNIKLASIKYNCAICFISNNANPAELKKILIDKFKVLSGFALLSNLPSGYQYDIVYWLNQHTLLSNKQINLHIQDNQLVLSVENEKSVNYKNDKNIFYINSKIIDNKNLHSDNWVLVNSNKALLEIASKSYSSTLVLSIDKVDEIDELAENIHHIRSTRGEYLKIVIVELKPCIRFSDERLLLACGANVMVHNGTSETHLFSLLESIQNQIYSNILPNNVKLLVDGMKPLRIKGFIPPQEFKDSITTLMSNTLLPEDGKGLLFVFKAVEGLHPKQTLSLCRIRRFGDIVTIDSENIYLFLSSCRLSDRESALRNIFQLPIDSIFKNKAVYSRDKDIQKHLLPLSSTKFEHYAVEIEVPELEGKAQLLVNDPKVYIPKPATLKFK